LSSDLNDNGAVASTEPEATTGTAPVARTKTTGLHVGEATPGCTKVDPIIIADGVRRSFGGVHAVDVDHLEIPRGAITALIGPNGAGKTTLFNLLTGFDVPNEGTWSFEGKSLSGVPAYKVSRLGLVRTFQLTKALGLLTVMENMKLGARNQIGEKFWASLIPALWRKQDDALEDQAMELLQRFKLDAKADDFAASLSGGQRKLLEMARSLMTIPKLVMLDEPMAGVNPALTQSLLDHILNLKDEGMTVLFVEHDMHMVRHIADWVIVMAEGRVVAEGDPHEVMKNPAVIDAYLGAHQELDLGVVTGRISVIDTDSTANAEASAQASADALVAEGIAEEEGTDAAPAAAAAPSSAPAPAPASDTNEEDAK
jgi:neutral amino acid transport system ATP-binding protein